MVSHAHILGKRLSHEDDVCIMATAQRRAAVNSTLLALASPDELGAVLRAIAEAPSATQEGCPPISRTLTDGEASICETAIAAQITRVERGA